MATRKIYTRNTDSDPWTERWEAETGILSLSDLDVLMGDMAVRLAVNGEPQVEVKDGLGAVKFTIKAS